jgi:hypothetical protein
MGGGSGYLVIDKLYQNVAQDRTHLAAFAGMCIFYAENFEPGNRLKKPPPFRNTLRTLDDITRKTPKHPAVGGGVFQFATNTPVHFKRNI